MFGDTVAVILGTIIIVAILLFTSWQSMITDGHNRELDLHLRLTFAHDMINIERGKIEIERKRREEYRQLERQRIVQEREILRRKWQLENL